MYVKAAIFFGKWNLLVYSLPIATRLAHTATGVLHLEFSVMSLTEKVVLDRSKAKGLSAVRNLNVWGCGLTDISILGNLPNLEVLNLR